MMTRKCRACGAEIFFAITPTGVSMPLDEKPMGGFLLVDEEGRRIDEPHVHSADLHITHRRFYTSHYATCTDPDRFRRKF